MGFIARALVSLLILGFMIVGVSFAADADCGASSPQEVKKAASDAPSTEKGMGAKVEGKITFIEPDGSMVVLTPKGRSQIVYVRNSSKIFKKDQEISRKELKVGDVINADLDSMRKAKRLEVLSQAP